MRPEDLSRRGRSEDSYGKRLTVVDDGPGAIEALLDFDAGLSVAAAVGEDLNEQ